MTCELLTDPKDKMQGRCGDLRTSTLTLPSKKHEEHKLLTTLLPNPEPGDAQVLLLPGGSSVCVTSLIAKVSKPFLISCRG